LPDLEQLNADIEKFCAKQIFRDRLWNSDRAFGELFDKISSGDAEWIAIAVKLGAVSDAHASESLVMAMSRALAKNPENVLSVLISNYKPGSFQAEMVFSTSEFDSNPNDRISKENACP